MRSPKRSSQSRTFPLLFLLVFVGAIFYWWLPHGPAIEPVVPKDIDKVEPQLREHILENVRLARESPQRADGHARLGLIYAINGLWLEAQSAFKNAAQLDSTQPLAPMYTGVCAQELGELEDAIRIFRETTKRFPDFAPGHYRLGYACLRAGRPNEESFKNLTNLAPTEWRGYAGLGEVSLRKGQAATALPLLEQAIRLDPSAKTAHHLLGQIYQALGRKDDAEWELHLGKNAVDSPMPDEWIKSATQHTKTLQGQTHLASEYSDNGEHAKAVEILLQALAYHRDDPGLMNQLAIVLDRSGQPSKARLVLKRALTKDPQNVPALVTLSLCEQKLGENESALATAERVITLAPNIAQGYVSQANAFLGLERDNDAVEALGKAARLDPQNPELPLQIGDILWRNLDRLSEAGDSYEKARQLDPVSPAVYVRLADLHIKRGEIGAAQICLDKLQRLAPKLPAAAILQDRLRARKP